MNYAQPLKKGSPQPVGASCGVIMKYDQNKTIGNGGREGLFEYLL